MSKSLVNGLGPIACITLEDAYVNCASKCDGLVFKDGSLVSGTLDALTLQLMPTANRKTNKKYVFTFLLSSRLFTEPFQLLENLIGLLNQELRNLDKKYASDLCCNVVDLVEEWTIQFPYDFRDDRMMQLLKSITQICVNVEDQLCPCVSSIFQNLLQKLTLLESYESFMAKIKPVSSDKLSCSIKATDIINICDNPLIVAQQLTHIELERLQKIGAEEFVQIFVKENSKRSSLKEGKRTKNLESYIKWFNRLSNLVASQVCSHLKKKHRVKVIEFYIDVAKECFNIGNFNSLMAIIGGLNLGPMSRLKKTWSKVDTSKLEILEHQMDPSSNFTSYRSTLKAAIWRYDGAVNDREKIIIPFFTLLVKDLHFVNEGCANRLQDSHINFEKCVQLAQQLEKFNSWKQATCPFEKNTDVVNYLFNCQLFSDDALLLASYECENPENNLEKERYKLLKTEVSTN